MFRQCPTCRGAGVVKSVESLALEVIRLLLVAACQAQIAHVKVHVAEDVAAYLNNKKRRELARIEDDGQMTILVLGHSNVSPEHLVLECRDADGHEVPFPPPRPEHP
jgi:ribonuclease E